MTNTTTQNWTDWPLEEFLSYVTSHSRTPRRLFSLDMIEHLHQLADHAINYDLYERQQIAGSDKPFARLEPTLADALVRAVRIRNM